MSHPVLCDPVATCQTACASVHYVAAQCAPHVHVVVDPCKHVTEHCKTVVHHVTEPCKTVARHCRHLVKKCCLPKKCK